MSPVAIEIAIKSTVLLLVIGALSLTLRRSSAAHRHGLWALGFVGLLFLPLLVIQVPTVAMKPVAVLASPPPPKTKPTKPFTIPTISLAEANLTAKPKPERPFPWASVLLLGWGAGAALIVLKSMGSLLRARGIAGRGESLQAASGIRVVRSSEIDVPMTFGLFRPVVLLPKASTEWPDERTRTVLLHESAHIARCDWGWIVLARLVCAAYWPNPLVWWAEARLRAESEWAADDAVLQAGVPAARYAEDLVEIAADIRSRRRPAHALSVVEPGTLKARVREILRTTKARHPLALRTALVGLTVGGLSVLAFSAARFVANPVSLAPVARPEGVIRAEDGHIDLPDGARLEIAAIQTADTPLRMAWLPDGRPSRLSKGREFHIGGWGFPTGKPGRLLYLWVKRSPVVAGRSTAIGAFYDGNGIPLSTGITSSFDGESERFDANAIQVTPDRRTTSVIFKVPIGPNRRIGSWKVGKPEVSLKPDKESGFFNLTIAIPSYVNRDNLHEYRFVPVDGAGKQVVLRNGFSSNLETREYYLVPPAKEAARIKAVDLYHRPSQWVEFPNIRLYPR